MAILVDALGLAAATLTTLCWLPQARQALRERDTRSISLPMTVLLAAGVALWLVYGIARGDWPIIGANAITLSLVLVILRLKLRYG